MPNDRNKNENTSNFELRISRRDITERDESVGIDKGAYLYIESSQKNEPIFIFVKKFTELYEKAKRETSIISSDPQIESNIGSLNEIKSQRPDFKELMSYLADKIDIDCSSFQENDELVVLSDISLYLELPWEDIVDKEIFISRKIIGNKNLKSSISENRLLFLMSHAHEGVGGDLKKKMDDEIKDIYNLLDLALENEQQSFRSEGLFILKHATKKSLQSLHWEDYNYVHLIMHGTQNGMLCLEKADKILYKYPDSISISEFLDIIKGNFFNLFFLSFCYSGGGVVDTENGNVDSLAFKIINEGIAQYAIGFSYPVGDITASSFSKIFYNNLFIGHAIKDAYIESLRKCYKINSKKYIPFLYTNTI